MSQANFSFGGSKYDFIFLGAGCASLSIVMRMIRNEKFRGKRILLIDKEPKTKNDRTWCFWEKQNGFFEQIVYKKWERLSFFSDHYSTVMQISPYQYKMIRGIDFYNHCFHEIAKYPNIEMLYGEASLVNVQGKKTIELNGKHLPVNDSIVFNSYIPDSTSSGKEISLLQHFKGWIIETPSPVFDPFIATFMDFRVDQDRGTTFAYVLPITSNQALVEYTLFTKEILADEEYDHELNLYVRDILSIKDYRIIEKEFGVIPMTTRKADFYSNDVYHIGTVGGQTKASTGYTFQFIQRQSDLIVSYLDQSKDLRQVPSAPNRFQFYDKVLLDVLHNDRAKGRDIFTSMFRRNKPRQVLKFLDNESSLAGEIKIISTLPTLPFLKAAINQF